MGAGEGNARRAVCALTAVAHTGLHGTQLVKCQRQQEKRNSRVAVDVKMKICTTTFSAITSGNTADDSWTSSSLFAIPTLAELDKFLGRYVGDRGV